MRSGSGGLMAAAPSLTTATYASSSHAAQNHINLATVPVSSSSTNPPQIPTPPEIIIDPRPVPGRPNGRRYLRGKILGKGGFAKCYEATDLDTRELWAVKIVAKASLVKQRAKVKLLSEIAIHKTLVHDKVVRYINHFDDIDFVYIILELCPNQTLNDLLKKKRRFSEPEAQYYIYELVQGLIYLRRERVIHRDLKLGNLFLGAEMELKIGDFGLAAKLDYDDEKKTTICGTPNYIAPEILDNHHKGHSFQVDVWSLGVVMFTMLVGKPPFEDVDVKSTYQRIRDNAYAFPESLYISSAAKNLIQSILRHDPKSRPTVFDIINHPWFGVVPSLPQSIQAMNRLLTAGSGSTSVAQTPRTTATTGAATMRTETPLNEVLQNRDFARIENSPQPAAVMMTGGYQKNFSAPSPMTAQRQPLRHHNPQQQVYQQYYQPSTNAGGGAPAGYYGTSTSSSSSRRQNSNDENRTYRAPTLMGSPVLRPPMAPMRSSMTGGRKTSNGGMLASPSGAGGYMPSPMVANPDEMFAPNNGRFSPSSLPEAWVVKWIDYSSKYGIGYLLSNGRIGVYFNDATKMVFSTSSNSRTVEYLYRQKGDKMDTVKLFSLDDDMLAGDAKKKTTLIKNFKGYLQTNNEKEGCTRGISAFSNFNDESSTGSNNGSTLPLHVKRWMRTKHALVFQLSNKVWQVVFQDRTEVILSAQTHLCHYISGGSGGVAVYPLGSIGDVADEYVAKRLAYSKQVVIHMLGGATNSHGGAANDIGAQ